jgi:hypothetical protein
MEKQQPPVVLHHGNHRRREARQKNPGMPDPETHLSMDVPSSSSLLSSTSTFLSLRPPSLVALTTAPSGRIKEGVSHRLGHTTEENP